MKKIELLFYLLKQVVPMGIGELTRIKLQTFFKHAILAPEERPVLSRKARTGFEPRSGDLYKLPFKRFSFSIPEIEEVIPTGLFYILAFWLRTDDPYGARRMKKIKAEEISSAFILFTS